jgi:hypothetical protein
VKACQTGSGAAGMLLQLIVDDLLGVEAVLMHLKRTEDDLVGILVGLLHDVEPHVVVLGEGVAIGDGKVSYDSALDMTSVTGAETRDRHRFDADALQARE